MSPFDPRLTLIAAQARVKTCHVYHCIMAMREMGKQFHQGAFASFTGLEERHVSAIMEALDGHEISPTKRQASSRGTRLPNDFEMPQEWKEWAIRKRKWDPSVVIEIAENFAAFWQAKTGTGATKLDWFKTWQNWVRNSRQADGDYTLKEERTPDQYIAFCESRLRAAKEKDWIAGIREWTEKLGQARAAASNVVPINRATG